MTHLHHLGKGHHDGHHTQLLPHGGGPYSLSSATRDVMGSECDVMSVRSLHEVCMTCARLQLCGAADSSCSIRLQWPRGWWHPSPYLSCLPIMPVMA